MRGGLSTRSMFVSNSVWLLALTVPILDINPLSRGSFNTRKARIRAFINCRVMIYTVEMYSWYISCTNRFKGLKVEGSNEGTPISG